MQACEAQNIGTPPHNIPDSRRENLAAMSWNEKNRIGSRVVVSVPGEEPFKTRTISEAHVDDYTGLASVFVDNLVGKAPLYLLVPVIERLEAV